MEVKIGASHTVSVVVDRSNTASAVGSGLLEVFATPMMISLMELAATRALEPFLEEGQASVGAVINITHDSATPPGMKVSATAEIIEVDRKRVVYKVEAFDEKGKIGGGSHTRFIVDIEKFMQKTAAKLGE